MSIFQTFKNNYKGQAPINYERDGRIVSIPPDKEDEFKDKLREHNDPEGKKAHSLSLGCAIGILAVLALLAMAIIRGA